MKTRSRVAVIISILGVAGPVAVISASAQPAKVRASADHGTPTARPTAATYVTADDLLTTLKQAPETSATDQAIRVVDAGSYNVGVYVIHRPQEADQGCTIEHDTFVLDNVTTIVRVIDGAGTLVTGGTLLEPAPMPVTDPDMALVGPGSRGSGIKGGESHRIAAGDTVIIPVGVPHGFSAIERSITYQVVRIDAGKVLAIK